MVPPALCRLVVQGNQLADRQLDADVPRRRLTSVGLAHHFDRERSESKRARVPPARPWTVVNDDDLAGLRTGAPTTLRRACFDVGGPVV